MAQFLRRPLMLDEKAVEHWVYMTSSTDPVLIVRVMTGFVRPDQSNEPFPIDLTPLADPRFKTRRMEFEDSHGWWLVIECDASRGDDGLTRLMISYSTSRPSSTTPEVPAQVAAAD